MLHRQTTFVPFERLGPPFRAIELHRTPRGVVAVTRLFAVGAYLSHQPAQRMITVLCHTARTVRRTHHLPGFVVLLVAAVPGGINFFHNLTKLVPTQQRGLPHRIHHAFQPVMFVIQEPGGATVGFDDGRRKRTVLQPGGGAGIAVGVNLLHPVAHLVIDEGNGITQRIDATREEFVVIPLVAPVLTALVNVANNQVLRVPVMLSRLTVVVIDGRQPGG
ncbi:Uncharacterised protein [Enterobacter hormaechei]|nr:Uncharacterised protein [Enterobacter hormaechei]SAF66711.1 Uncharacterised protein [Enterobacter hormaechei]